MITNGMQITKCFIQYFSGPLLQDPTTFEVPLIRSKEKEILVNSVLETLTNLFPSSSYLKTNIDTEMGFILGRYKSFTIKVYCKYFYTGSVYWDILVRCCPNMLHKMLTTILETKFNDPLIFGM